MQYTLRRPRFSLLSASLLPFLLAAGLVPSLPSPALAVGVSFSVSAKGQQPMLLGVNAISQEDDAIWKKSNQANVLAEEKNFYSFITGYSPVPPGTDVNGYQITSNEATLRMNCAGLALLRLIGGPFIMNTGPALLLLQTFGRQLADSERTERWDVVVFMRDGQPQHLALVERGDAAPGSVILSKDGPERIYRGRLTDFPNKSSLGTNLKNFGTPVIYRLDWDAIDVRRLDEPEVPVPPDAAKIGWMRTPPSARIQKTLIEAADEISKTLSLPAYGPSDNLIDPHVEWQWRVPSFEHFASITCADYAPPSTRARETVNVWIGRAPVFSGRPIQPFQIAGQPNELAVRHGPSDRTCSYNWSCGRHYLTAGINVGITVFPSKDLEPEANAISGRVAETMFLILSRRAIANGLDKPERPRTNYPYEGDAAP